MRFAVIAWILMVAISAPVAADSLVNEPHALVYYQLSFSGDAPDTRSHFGLRMDRTQREAGKTFDYREVLSRPGIVDLRFNDAGMESFTLAGVDYLARYRTLNADAGQTPEAGAAEAKAGEKKAAKPDDEAKAEDDKLTMDKVMHKIPIGYFIGAGIGALLLATSAAD